MENIHEGHRSRLKKRFYEHGLESFTDIEALELLLFYAVPRRDTNEMAHRLLDFFGSYRAVMEADAYELAQVPGVGESAAGLIRLVAELGRRYGIAERKEGRIITSSKAAGEYLLPLYAFQKDELVYVLSLDSRSMVKRCRSIARGMSARVDFSVRDIIEAALKDNTTRMIVSHNHLSGTALPSASDIDTTKKLKSALALIGVELIDHIIVCDGDFVSLRDSGCFNML